MARSRTLAGVGVSLAVLAGCGSSSRSHTSASAAGSTASTPTPAPPLPGPAATGRPADPAAVRVIRGWSDTLRHGDVRGAARYFAIPSRFVQPAGGGAAVVTIRDLRAAVGVNATLPCGARLLSSDQRGRYVNALFRLTDRPGLGGGCGGGIGATARTNFVIRRGKIVDWIRAPDEPRDRVVPPVAGAPAPAPAPAKRPPLGGGAV